MHFQIGRELNALLALPTWKAIRALNPRREHSVAVKNDKLLPQCKCVVFNVITKNLFFKKGNMLNWTFFGGKNT